MPLVVLLPVVFSTLPSPHAASQTLDDMVRRTRPDSVRVESRPSLDWRIAVGEVLVGSALAAAAGYGVGLLAESMCDGCDASQPGGDTPGLVLGVPVGAVAGVWLIGRLEPPPGRLGDTLLGALAGTAVFAGYSEILNEQSSAVRWTGVIFPGALAAMGWNRSRATVRVESAEIRGLGPAVVTELVLLRREF